MHSMECEMHSIITLAMIPVQLEEENTNMLIAKLLYTHESR